MIICPRCGYPAPDGSPWCPRCGYGCPYPMPPQQLQQPPQMPVPYQPQQIPARYEKENIPPVPELPKQKPPKNGKKRKTVLGCLVLIFILCCIGAIFAMLLTPSKKSEPTATPTMAPTNTERPTRTLAPTRTPAPTATDRPESCNIKGNRNELIYHCKNSPNYETTTDFIQWFCSPEEAEAAGYRPAKTMYGRCQQ